MKKQISILVNNLYDCPCLFTVEIHRRGTRIAVGFSRNVVIISGCLFEFVTLIGRVTGGESGSKCAH